MSTTKTLDVVSAGLVRKTKQVVHLIDISERVFGLFDDVIVVPLTPSSGPTNDFVKVDLCVLHFYKK